LRAQSAENTNENVTTRAVALPTHVRALAVDAAEHKCGTDVALIRQGEKRRKEGMDE
jgi:hypothetical protein